MLKAVTQDEPLGKYEPFLTYKEKNKIIREYKKNYSKNE